MNRRNFINKGAALFVIGATANKEMFASATSSLMSSSSEEMLASAAAKRNKGRLGFQLYGVRKALETDFIGGLKKLSAIGFSEVETFGPYEEKFYGRSMKELDVIVKDLGMSISGTHYQGWKMLPEDTNSPEWDNWKYCISELNSVKCKWAIQASMPGGELKSMDDIKRVTAHFNRTGELCKKNGLKFAFHNHPQDFKVIDGVCAFDYILKNTDPKLVSFQVDFGNIINVGRDCVQILRENPGRFPLWHTTDYDAAARKSMLAGEGDVPFPALMEQAKPLGLEVLTVELHTDPDNYDSVKKVFDYMKQFKWTKA